MPKSCICSLVLHERFGELYRAKFVADGHILIEKLSKEIPVYLAIDPADTSRILIPVVGLPFSDYGRVQDRLTVGSTLFLKPVDDNPHDPKAVEVYFQDEEDSVHVGFVPRNAAPGVRLALSLEALESEVSVGRADADLAMSVSKDVMVGFIQMAGASAERTLQQSTPDYESDDWPFRAVMPGDVEELSASEDGLKLLLSLMDRLRAKDPESAVLKAAEKGVAEDEEFAADDHLFAVSDAVEDRLIGIQDTDFDAACARDKIGGLPYCEAGWVWPSCPCCGREMVFLGQSYDPGNPGDLIQAFWCVDTIECECDEGACQTQPNSTVRIWRDPADISPATITPDDKILIVPGHRLEEATEGDASGMPEMERDGIAHSHFNQCSYEEGRHRVFEINLGENFFDGEGPEDYTVIRQGRGVVTSWEDWGG